MDKGKVGEDMKEVQQLMTDCFSLPKVELHAHIGGCIRPETFLELAEKKGVSVEHIDFYKVDIKMAFEIFVVGSKLVTDLATLHRITTEIIADYAKHNCAYLELRSTPKAFGENSKNDYVNTVINAIKESETEHMRVRYLISVNRSSGVADAKEAAQLLRDMKGEYVVGIELSGHPEQASFNDYKEIFEELQKEGTKISLHCAETKN